MRTLLFIVLSILFSYTFSAQESMILNVPYKVQPDNKSCQSTCLKMLAMHKSISSQDKSIEKIYQEINDSPERPLKGPDPNYWKNIEWWWNKNAGDQKMQVKTTTEEGPAIEFIVNSINNNFPVLMSVSNEKTSGHLILVVGYKNHLPNQSNPDFRLVCHDPYGRFFPELRSRLYGDQRHAYGSSLPDGSEDGIGKGVEIKMSNLRRLKSNDYFKDQFVMFGS